jgi:hypothetical protein
MGSIANVFRWDSSSGCRTSHSDFM